MKKYTIDGCFSAITYNQTTRKLIYSFKYKPFLTDLQTVLSDLFYESIIQNEGFNFELIKNKDWILVPIPLYKSKLKKRGYNHAEILAKILSEKLNFPSQNLLIRTKNTVSQYGLKLEARKINIQGAFSYHSQQSELKNQNIFLVDDIVTTGSTLLEAANILKRNGAKRVVGITLARD